MKGWKKWADTGHWRRECGWVGSPKFLWSNIFIYFFHHWGPLPSEKPYTCVTNLQNDLWSSKQIQRLTVWMQKVWMSRLWTVSERACLVGGFVLLCAPSLLWSSLWSNALECDVSRHFPASPFLLHKPKIYSFISSRADLILIGVSASLAAVGMPTWCKLYEHCKGIYGLQWCTGRCAGDSSKTAHNQKCTYAYTANLFCILLPLFFSENCRVHELFFK